MAHSAEEFTIRATGPLVFRLSVDSLETFAETGEATGNFRLLARFLKDDLAGLQPLLNFRFPLDVGTVGNLSYSPLIDVNVQGLLDLKRELAIYLSYNRAAVQAIQADAAAEAATQTDLNLSDLPDLSQSGPYSFTQRTITVTNPALRQTGQGLSVNYDFDVDVYLPEGRPGPAPIVIVSHGSRHLERLAGILRSLRARYAGLLFEPIDPVDPGPGFSPLTQ